MNRILSLSQLNWKLRWEEGLNEVGRMAQQFHWFWFLSLSPLHSSRPFGCLIKKKQIIPAYPVPAPFHRHRHRQSPCKHFAFAYGPVLSSALASLHSLAKCRIQFSASFHLSLRELNFPTKNPSQRWAWASINALLFTPGNAWKYIIKFHKNNPSFLRNVHKSPPTRIETAHTTIRALRIQSNRSWAQKTQHF